MVQRAFMVAFQIPSKDQKLLAPSKLCKSEDGNHAVRLRSTSPRQAGDGKPEFDTLEAMMMRKDCEKGFFVSFDYSSDALQEIESFFNRSHKVIVALTVQEILDEQIAKKLV